MNKKMVIFIIIGIVSLVALTGFAYADRFDGHFSHMRGFDNNDSDEMIDIMKENGYEDVAESVENGDYEKMDEFMNNITDEDYEKMTKLMKENGYGHMSNMMENTSKDEMIEMHNDMGGAEACH
ncbi:MAG: hypothetical protein ACTHVE_07190 [Senegalia sp. (in: firmicutes)]|uniref:hypothetical protein n=1 Tax=Senegalia sp. (in: firmicutes) TaxID=1924098 RepID=UPI003F96668D